MQRIFPKRFIEHHPKAWHDKEGRTWLFQSDLQKEFDWVHTWRDSSDWDDFHRLVWGIVPGDVVLPMSDEIYELTRGSSSIRVEVIDMLVPRGFKWAALVSIYSSSNPVK